MPPYCKHIKGKHYGTEIDDWVDGYFKYLKSTEPWNYDFENGKEKYLENTDYEQSILSQLIFIEIFKSQKLSADICECGLSITVNKGTVKKTFLFDVMHNPKRGCQPCQQAILNNYNGGKMQFENIYHCVGNFAPIPRTIISKNYGPRLQQIHEYLNELWPCLLKFMQDNWMCFPTDIYELMSFKEYMKYSCQQMYYERIFNKLYCIYNASENKTDNRWDKIIRELANIVIDEQDRLRSFDNLLKKSDIEMIEEIDKRITFLIELRGRFIIYLLKKHHFTTL